MYIVTLLQECSGRRHHQCIGRNAFHQHLLLVPEWNVIRLACALPSFTIQTKSPVESFCSAVTGSVKARMLTNGQGDGRKTTNGVEFVCGQRRPTAAVRCSECMRGLIRRTVPSKRVPSAMTISPRCPRASCASRVSGTCNSTSLMPCLQYGTTLPRSTMRRWRCLVRKLRHWPVPESQHARAWFQIIEWAWLL